MDGKLSEGQRASIYNITFNKQADKDAVKGLPVSNKGNLLEARRHVAPVVKNAAAVLGLEKQLDDDSVNKDVTDIVKRQIAENNDRPVIKRR